VCSSDFRSLKDFGSLVICRTGTANGTEDHATEHHQSAKEGVGPHLFAKEEEFSSPKEGLVEDNYFCTFYINGVMRILLFSTTEKCPTQLV
jgi:hypothetical protein